MSRITESLQRGLKVQYTCWSEIQRDPDPRTGLPVLSEDWYASVMPLAEANQATWHGRKVKYFKEGDEAVLPNHGVFTHRHDQDKSAGSGWWEDSRR